jgi:uncharacterized phage-associated protein
MVFLRYSPDVNQIFLRLRSEVVAAPVVDNCGSQTTPLTVKDNRVTFMVTTASNVAKYLVNHFCAQGKPISNLKLQKLLYYCQGWHLAIMDQPLFEDPVQAWVHGPVVPSAFQEYRKYGWSPIPAGTAPAEMPAESVGVIGEVIQVYGDWSAAQLEQLSHEESPWRDTRGSLPPIRWLRLGDQPQSDGRLFQQSLIFPEWRRKSPVDLPPQSYNISSSLLGTLI